MDHNLLKYRIGLTLIHGIGNNLAKNLIAYLGNEQAVFFEKTRALTRIPGIGKALAKEIVNSQHVLERAEKEIEFIQKKRISCHYYTDKSYPERLRECVDAPLLLYSHGTQDLNNARFVAVVGTRHATEYGKSQCRELIEKLSNIPQLVIVSGLAYGVDICAHKAAIDNKIPTIGVVAHGLDMIYPASHRQMAVKMAENGSLITEYISQTNPERPFFVQRNRIIAGITDALVVVESGSKGGALITAELANDYNREVFAFPGKTNDEWSKGCNALIKKNKASLIESADDLITAMNWETNIGSTHNTQLPLFQELTEEEATIMQVLKQHPEGMQINELVLALNIPFHRLSSLMLQAEFKNIVQSLPGGVYKSR